MLSIDARSSRELQALILSMRQASREVAKIARRYTREMVLPEWRKALAEQADTRLEHIVLVDSSRVTVSNQDVRLRSGQLARKLSGGARTHEISKQVEFGASLRESRYTGRRGSKTFPVSRTTGRQFKHENSKGWVVYQAAAQIIPRIAAVWVQTVVRTFAEAVERK